MLISGQKNFLEIGDMYVDNVATIKVVGFVSSTYMNGEDNIFVIKLINSSKKGKYWHISENNIKDMIKNGEGKIFKQHKCKTI